MLQLTRHYQWRTIAEKDARSTAKWSADVQAMKDKIFRDIDCDSGARRDSAYDDQRELVAQVFCILDRLFLPTGHIGDTIRAQVTRTRAHVYRESASPARGPNSEEFARRRGSPEQNTYYQ